MLRKLKAHSLVALPFLHAIVHLFHDMACYVTMLWVPSKLNIADAPVVGFTMAAIPCHPVWPLTSVLAIAQRFRCLELASIWHANGTHCLLPLLLPCWLLVGLFLLSPLFVTKFTLRLPLLCAMLKEEIGLQHCFCLYPESLFVRKHGNISFVGKCL